MCELISINNKNKKKDAYIIEKDDRVGNKFKIKGKEWEIKNITRFSVSEGILDTLKRVDKIGYKKEKK